MGEEVNKSAEENCYAEGGGCTRGWMDGVEERSFKLYENNEHNFIVVVQEDEKELIIFKLVDLFDEKRICDYCKNGQI